MKKANNKGFSLVELVIVVAILGVLAAITINAYVSLVERARLRADETHALNIKNALRVYIFESNDTNAERLLAMGTGTSDVDKIISALQVVIDEKYGPYLENVGGMPASAEDYNPRAKGKTGWFITIDTNTLSVSVVPTAEDDENNDLLKIIR